MSTTEVSLDDLFSPDSFDAFCEQTAVARPVARHAPLERFEWLKAWPQFKSVIELFAMHTGRAQVRLVDDNGGPVEIHMDADQASRVYRAGATVLLARWDLFCAPVGALCRKLEGALGIRQGSATGHVHVSSRGSGLPAHFDHQDALTIQVLGEKRWDYRTEPVIAAPPSSLSAGEPVPDLLRRCAVRPDELKGPKPNASDSVVLAPGSVFFMPRGYWHSTEALSESVSITIGWSGTTWLERLVTELREKLMDDVRWRSPSFGALPNAAPSLRASARATAEALVQEGVTRLLTDPSQLLGAVGVGVSSIEDVVSVLRAHYVPPKNGDSLTIELRSTDEKERRLLRLGPDGMVTGDGSADLVFSATLGVYAELLSKPTSAGMLVASGRLSCHPLDMSVLSRFANRFSLFTGAA